MNAEKVKGILEKVKNALKKVSKKIWILIAAVVSVLAVGIAIFVNNRPYATLITGASADEAGAVVTWLTEQGITDYRMEGTGTILVPEGQASNLKARLLMEQYSNKTSSYSGYFERVSALSTQSDRENAWLITLTEVLEDTICQFEGVRSANVTINMGEDRRYILDSNNAAKASASVKVTMEGNQLLTTEQATAIRNYVAHSVAQLDVGDVYITDSWGNNYSLLGSKNAADDSALKLQLEQEYGNLIRQRIMQVLIPFYGEDNVDVAVNVVVQIDDITIDEYTPTLPSEAQWTQSGGAGIIGSRVGSYTVLTGEQIAQGGLVGTPSNSNLPTDVEQDPTTNDYDGRLEGGYEIIYDNPKTQTHTVRTAGYITDCTVSVSINSNAVQGGIVNTDEVVRHAANAAGITGIATETMTAQEYLNGKISVMVGPYWDPNAPLPGEPGEIVDGPGFLTTYLWVIIAAGVGLVLFAIVLTVILLIRRKKRRKQEEEQKAIDELMAVAMPEEEPEEPQFDENGNPITGADVMDLHTERSMELRQSIRDFVDENMEVAALLIRGWLKGEENDG